MYGVMFRECVHLHTYQAADYGISSRFTNRGTSEIPSHVSMVVTL